MFPKSGIPVFESCFTENYYRIITKQEVLIMINATIVLEGGATRGVFTSGVLDYLMEQDTYLSHVIGVSAGACNAVDYVSKQIGRTRNCMIVEDKNTTITIIFVISCVKRVFWIWTWFLTSTHAKSFHLISKHFRNPVNKAWSASKSQRTALPEKQNI